MRKILLWAVPVAVALTLGGTARAAGPAHRAKALRLFGQTFCLGAVAPGVHCDHRLWGPNRAASGPSARSAPAQAMTLFGVTFCAASAPADTHCEVRLPRSGPAPAPTRTASAKVWHLFGLNICMGPVPSSAHCNLAIPGRTAHSHPRQASL